MNNEVLQIVAVIFKSWNQATMNFKRANEKPYFYLDVLGAKVGDYALVHNGNEFSVVEVMRVINVTDPVAISRVTKPLLALFIYYPELVGPSAQKLEEYKAKTEDARIQRDIDDVLDSERLERMRQLRLARAKVDDDEEIPF